MSTEFGEFGARLASVRVAAGMTQQGVADALGISVQAYQNYEYGKRDVKGTTLAKLAGLFGCTVNYLLGIDSFANRPEEDPLRRQVTECYDAMNQRGRATLASGARSMALDPVNSR